MKKDAHFAVALVVLIHVQLSTQVYHTDNKRTSFLATKEDHHFPRHIFQTLPANTFIECVHLCLGKRKCKSLNFLTLRRRCELIDIAPDGLIASNGGVSMLPEQASVFAWWLNLQIETFTFSTLGAHGADGPTNVDGYVSTNLEGLVQLNSGIQLWTTPHTGRYVIEAFGASGANGTCSICSNWTLGGRGAKIKGQFSLEKGVQLKILIGQMGERPDRLSFSQAPGGGGGGTFVALAADHTPLIVAGGGGGGGIPLAGENRDGDPAEVNTNGTCYGGHDGGGGRFYDRVTNTYSGMQYSTGAGYSMNGVATLASASRSFTNGGIGGKGTAEGGFGGGGAPVAEKPGGGGGYSGGGVVSTASGAMAGGGGSYNNGADQQNIAGANEGDGKVVITYGI